MIFEDLNGIETLVHYVIYYRIPEKCNYIVNTQLKTQSAYYLILLFLVSNNAQF